MRKIYSFMIAAFAMAAAISCTKEFEDVSTVKPEEALETIVFTASLGEETKAKLNEMKSEWVSGDNITICEGANSFEFKTTDNGPSAQFSATVSGFKGSKYVGIYPYNVHNTADVNNYIAYGNIPTKQTATKDSYDPKAALAVAYSETNSLAFKNAHALLKFTVSGQNAKGVTFSGNNSENLTGRIKATLNSNGDVNTIEFKDNHLYLKPNANWKQNNARFAAYFFGNGERWVNMTATDVDGVYDVAIPTDKTFTHVIFCRMNPNSTTNGWTQNTQKWNQTSDLTIPADNNVCYTVAEGAWDKGEGSWGTHALYNTYAELNGTLAKGTYYMVVAPQNFTKGFHLEMHFGEKKMKIKNLASKFNIEPNKIYNLGSLDYKLYFKPNSNWKSANARFAAYFFLEENNTKYETWVSMTGEDKDGIYEVLVPADRWYNKVIFCRMNPSATANDWPNKWDQTNDLDVPSNGTDLTNANNYYIYPDNVWSYGNGSWSKKD